MKQPDACIVRITDAEGETQGTGFLVSTDGLIVTCAHVVEGTEPCVAFPGSEPCPAQIVSVDEAHDVVFLRLTAALPENIIPAELAPSVRLEGTAVRAFGYPKVGDIEGLWGVGQLVGYVTEAGKSLLQLGSTQITKGFSGGPVWDAVTNRVIGMVVQIAPSDRYGKLEDVAFAVPAETLRALCPEELVFHYTLPPGVPFQAPVIPRYFVPRPEVSNDLKACLLADEATAPGALVVSAVHGLGGIGKTTLVAALAHDSDLQARFPDGILWATLGQQPDVLSLLVGWIQALRDYDFRPTVVESASNQLRTLLHDKACLLVVDDAWQADHVRPFLVGEKRCRVLVTTRDATLARKVGARLYDLDVMTEAQALALFEARLGPLDGHRDQAAALARELGYLPLALELAAAQVEAGLSWTELLDTFRQELADLAALDLDEATYRNESLRLSFRLSLEQLSPNDQKAFAWLGVLPEDARLNPAMAATLWDQAEVDARKRLRRLRDKALLKTVDDDQYTVHDLLHDEAKLRLTGQMSLPEAHASLLARYRALAQDGLWHTLPDDNYIYAHLSWHLGEAGWFEELHKLVAEGIDKPFWAETRRFVEGTYAGYLSDLALAWSHVDKVGLSTSTTVGRQVRYALIESSVHSLAANIPAELLVALVEHGVWSSKAALTYAQQIPDNWQRALGLAHLSMLLQKRNEEALVHEASVGALAAVRDVSVTYDRAYILATLMPHLPPDLLSEAWSVACTVVGDEYNAFMGLVPHLPKDLVPEALQAVYTIGDQDARNCALIALVPHLPSHLLSEAFIAEVIQAARRIGKESGVVHVVTALVPRLSSEKRTQLLTVALDAAHSIEDKQTRVDALASLVPYLPALQQSPVLAEAVVTARTIQQGAARASALATLIPLLPSEQRAPVLADALAAALVITDGARRARVLIALASHLSSEEQLRVLSEALTAARTIENGVSFADTLTHLASHFPLEQQPTVLLEALATARAIPNELDRARTIASLIPYLPAEQRLPVLTEALGFDPASAAQTGPPRLVSARIRLGELLSPRVSFPHPLDAALDIVDIWECCMAQIRFAHNLPAEQRLSVLTQVLHYDNFLEWECFRALAGAILMPYLTQEEQPRFYSRALVATHAIRTAYDRIRALTALATRLPQAKCYSALIEILEIATTVGDEEARNECLAALVPLLPELPTQALNIVSALLETRKMGVYHAQALAALASHLPAEQSISLLSAALLAICTIEDERERTKALILLAPYLPPKLQIPVLTEALNTTLTRWPFDRDRAEFLRKLVPQLPPGLLPVALDRACTAIMEESYRAMVLSALSPRLPHELLPKALAAARAIRMDISRAETLAAIAPHLPLEQRLPVLTEALAVVCAEVKTGSSWAVNVLSTLTPHLPQEFLTEALAIVRATKDMQRAKALAVIAPYLPWEQQSEVLSEALASARAIDDAYGRAWTLIGLAPYLPYDQRLAILEEAMAAAQHIQTAHNHAEVLAAIAWYLPTDQRLKILAEALTSAREIDSTYHRAPILSRLALMWAQLSPEQAYPHWFLTLHISAQNRRVDLLEDLQRVTPVLAALGGQEAIVETFRAIQDVGRWWP